MSSRRPRGARGINFRLVGAILLTVALGTVFFLLKSPSPVTVATANQVIPAGTRLSAEMISPIEFEAKDLPAQIIQIGEIDGFLGKVATATLYPNAVLQESDFYVSRVPSEGETAAEAQAFAYQWSQLLTADQRAVVLIGDPTSTFVSAGDMVDIFYIGEENVKKLFTKRVLYAIPQPLPAAGGTTAEGTAFVLDLTAQQAQDLIYAQTNGELRIAIASPDSETIPTTVITDADYFSETYDVQLPGQGGEPSEEPVESEAPSESGLPQPSEDPAASGEPSETVQGLTGG